MTSTLVHGQWLDNFCCIGCGKGGPDRAVVIGEVALCVDCALPLWSTIEDGDCEGRDPLPFPEYRRQR